MSKNKRQSITINIPLFNIAALIVDYGQMAEAKKDSVISNIKKNGLSFKKPSFKFFKNFDPKKYLGFLSKFSVVLTRKAVFVPIILIVLVGIGLFTFRSKLPSSASTIVSGNTSGTDFAPNSTQELRREFQIPIRSADGKDTGDKLVVNFTTVDKSRRIILQGQPATAKDGKVFLILNVDVENSTTNQLSVRPVDFIRMIDDKGENFAADIHNDVVKVEPISIKKTRVGFIVDESQKNFKFAVGEIKGSKETAEVSF